MARPLPAGTAESVPNPDTEPRPQGADGRGKDFQSNRDRQGPGAAYFGGSFTIPTQNSFTAFTTRTKFSNSSGLVI